MSRIEVIYKAVVEHEKCFVPCACFNVPHKGSCRSLADKIAVALVEHDAQTASVRGDDNQILTQDKGKEPA